MSQPLSDTQLKAHQFNSRQNNRLTRDSQAVVKRIALFSDGKISASAEAKAVWLSDPVFQAHKLHNFRTCYNNIRKDFMEGKPESIFYQFIFFIFIFSQIHNSNLFLKCLQILRLI